MDDMGKEFLLFLDREIKHLDEVEQSYEEYPHNPAKYNTAGRRQEAERIKAKVVTCLNQLSAYEATNLLPEEIKLLGLAYEKRVCVGCWLKDEKKTGSLIGQLRTRIDKAITELNNVKNGQLGDKSMGDCVQEIIDQLETEQGA